MWLPICPCKKEPKASPVECDHLASGPRSLHLKFLAVNFSTFAFIPTDEQLAA
jgi:hypothetical protein